jgi:DNA-binding protein Fis
MDYARGNRTRAARLLGLSYKAFLYRWKKREEQQEDSG